MSWTKRQLVEEAFAEIGLAVYSFDIQPEQLARALRRLDAMMATWNAKGIRIGYPIPLSPENSNLDQDSNAPDSANQAIITNLAIQIAPGHGKQLSPETKQTAKDSYKVLLDEAAMPNEKQFPGTLPVGAGNKTDRDDYRTFFPKPKDPVQTGQDGTLDYN